MTVRIRQEVDDYWAKLTAGGGRPGLKQAAGQR